MACPRGTRRTVQPSAGTCKGWKTQAITLVLSVRLAGVPGHWKPRSSLSIWAPVQMEKIMKTFLSHQLWISTCSGNFRLLGRRSSDYLFILSPVSGFLPPKSPIAPVAKTENTALISRGMYDFGDGGGKQWERIVKVGNLQFQRQQNYRQ